VPSGSHGQGFKPAAFPLSWPLATTPHFAEEKSGGQLAPKLLRCSHCVTTDPGHLINLGTFQRRSNSFAVGAFPNRLDALAAHGGGGSERPCTCLLSGSLLCAALGIEPKVGALVMGLAESMMTLYELDYIACPYEWIQLCGKSHLFGGVVRCWCWCGAVVRCWCWCGGVVKCWCWCGGVVRCWYWCGVL